MRIVFIGTGEIGVPTLRALLDSEHEVAAVVTQPDKPVGREQRIEPPPIKKAITTSGDFSLKERRLGQPSTGNVTAGKPSLLEILQPARIKDLQPIEEIRRLTPDVIVVVAYGQILPRAVLAACVVAAATADGLANGKAPARNGATAFAERASEELARIGGRRPRFAHELTPSQQRVAELIAGGASNKEIAASLFISEHTVESHLRQIYMKLGVSSRVQLTLHLLRE